MSSIKEEIQRLKKKLGHNFYMDNPEYAELKGIINDATSKLYKLEKELWSQVCAKKEIIENRIKELNQSIAVAQSKKAPKITPEIERWFYKDYCSGVNFGYGSKSDVIKIVWLSKDKKYAIVTNKGGTGWVCQGTFAYHKSSSWLIRIGWLKYQDRDHIIDENGNDKIIHNRWNEIEGRLTKNHKLGMLEKIKELRVFFNEPTDEIDAI